jgi:hypothetical protein
LRGGQKKLIGWRASDYTDETSDPELAKNWAAAIGVLPIFEGDVNTVLDARALLAAREQEPWRTCAMVTMGVNTTATTNFRVAPEVFRSTPTPR